jgi:hypothetical protein
MKWVCTGMNEAWIWTGQLHAKTMHTNMPNENILGMKWVFTCMNAAWIWTGQLHAKNMHTSMPNENILGMNAAWMRHEFEVVQFHATNMPKTCLMRIYLAWKGLWLHEFGMKANWYSFMPETCHILGMKAAWMRHEFEVVQFHATNMPKTCLMRIYLAWKGLRLHEFGMNSNWYSFMPETCHIHAYFMHPFRFSCLFFSSGWLLHKNYIW